MTFPLYLLVLVSAFTHAYWNFVLKRAEGTHIFIGLSKIAEIILFAAPFIYLVAKDHIALFDYWVFYIVGALLVIFNYIFLGQAYKSGDLSLVYPISRAGALLFLPALAYFFIGEEIDLVGFVAILLIMLGLFSIQMRSFSFNEMKLVITKLISSATLQALLAAFTAACYTLWDKHSINYLSPFVYFYAYTAVTGIVYAIFIFTNYPLPEIKKNWAKHKFSIFQVGFFNTLTYLLVLYCLQTGKVSYVIALRQLSIAFGVFLGWRFLKEALPLTKKTGIALLLTGCLLISLAR